MTSDAGGNEREDLFATGLTEFNAGEFFACHETLEIYWKAQAMPSKELTQGTIQIAVGHYHLGRGNVKGAIKLFERGLLRVAKFLPAACGLALEPLYGSTAANIELLKSGCAFDDPRLTIPIIEKN